MNHPLRIFGLLASLLLGVAFLSACGGTDEDVEPASQQLLSRLAGDWMVYSVHDESPHQARSTDFWTFKVTDTRFELSEACGEPHSYGEVRDGKLYLYEPPADHVLGEELAGAPVVSAHPIEMVDDTLVIHERQGGEQVGRVFHARPVATLSCEDGRVAVQTVIPREEIEATALAGGAARSLLASASTHQDLVLHLKDSAGTLLAPQGDPKDLGLVQKDGTDPKVTTESTDTTTITCTETEMTQREVLNTFTLFDTSTNLYPGALVQGGPYMTDNEFKLITAGTQDDPLARKRAPLTVQVKGPVLDGKLSAQVADPSKSENVAQAIRDLIAAGVAGGEVNMDFVSTLASNERQVNLSLGVAGGYEGFKLSTDFEAGVQEDSNHFVFYFFQKFYSVTIDPFGGALEAFDPTATDPADEITGAQQIGADNPPLYVSQVDYGKQIMFEINSTFSEENIKTLLSFAADAKEASASINSSFTASDVMAASSIKYKVRGGSDKDVADWNVFPGTGEGDGSTLFNNLKGFFSNLKAEPFTADTPGVPIGFTLTYLVDDSPASMLYASDFTQKSCSTSAAPIDYAFTYSITGYQPSASTIDDYDLGNEVGWPSGSGLDDHLTVSVGGTKVKSYNSPKGDKTWKNQKNLNTYLSDGETHKTKFELYNKGGWGTGGKLSLYKEKDLIYQISIYGGTGAWTGKVFEVEFDLNKDGTCSVQFLYEPGTSANNIFYKKHKGNTCK
ncbi:MAG: thiol-activated cytolysin family protein [Deferrisomatales bacterium]|nr:thiol-activated cytolysin family protein [Deferrisomatales bacterium]